MELGLVGQQAGNGRLADTGRAPEDQRAERARRAQARERAFRAEQMILPDHFGQFLRPQPVGQRLRRTCLKARGGE